VANRQWLGVIAYLSLASLLVLFYPLPLAGQETPAGDAAALRAQLEKLQKELREIERQDELRGKVTEIGASSGRTRDYDEPRLVVKVYDLSDLFTVAPSYPAYEPLELLRGSEPQPVFPHVETKGVDAGGAGFGGGGFGGGGGFFSVPNSGQRPATVDREFPSTLHQASGVSGAAASSVRTSMDSLIQTITSTIDPDGWADVGGPSTIAPVGSSLIVTTTSQTHAKLVALIDLFRQRWGSLRTISVHAHWLWLSPSQVEETLSPPAQNAVNKQASLNSLTLDAWKKLLAAAEQNAGRSGYHAIVTCYNGQTVATQAGSQRLAVIGLVPVVTGGENAGVSFTPQLRTIHDGVTLQVTPLATRQGKYVVLDIHSRVNLLPPAAPIAKEEAPQPFAANTNDPRRLVEALERGAVQTQRLETTLRLPVGEPTLIGGMTFAGPDGKSSHLYLFITAKVQELRDDDSTVAAPQTPPADKPADKK
jgi:hypothetical protein